MLDLEDILNDLEVSQLTVLQKLVLRKIVRKLSSLETGQGASVGQGSSTLGKSVRQARSEFFRG